MFTDGRPGREIEIALASILAAGHVLVGVTGILAPRFLMRFWAGRDPRAEHVRTSGLAIGMRDFAVGAGTLMALRRGQIRSAWSECAALSDTVDALGTLLFFRHTPWGRRTFIVVCVGASAIAGHWLNRPGPAGGYSSGPTA